VLAAFVGQLARAAAVPSPVGRWGAQRRRSGTRHAGLAIDTREA